MPIPDYQSLMLPVLVASSNGEVRIGAVVDQLAQQLGLAPEERSALLPSGKQTIFSNRVHWAKTYLGKAGLIESTRRAHFKITPRGQQVLDSHPACIDNAFLGQFDEFRQFTEKSAQAADEGQRPAATTFESQSATPDEAMRVAQRQIEETLAQDLLDRIQKASSEFFEHLIVNLLREMKFGVSVRPLGRSGDGGVDGVVDQDALGLDRIYIQAKRYATGNNIGPGAIRDFFGGLDRHKAAKGLFVTTSTFSASAKETAELLSKRIVLIDGEQLTKLMIRHNVGCRVEETLAIKTIDENFFE